MKRLTDIVVDLGLRWVSQLEKGFVKRVLTIRWISNDHWMAELRRDNSLKSTSGEQP